VGNYSYLLDLSFQRMTTGVTPGWNPVHCIFKSSDGFHLSLRWDDGGPFLPAT